MIMPMKTKNTQSHTHADAFSSYSLNLAPLTFLLWYLKEELILNGILVTQDCAALYR